MNRAERRSLVDSLTWPDKQASGHFFARKLSEGEFVDFVRGFLQVDPEDVLRAALVWWEMSRGQVAVDREVRDCRAAVIRRAAR